VGRDLAFVLQDFNKRNEGGEGTGERREEEGREGGKEKGWEGKGKDLPDQCEFASYLPELLLFFCFIYLFIYFLYFFTLGRYDPAGV